ncbi:hypothetical protein HK105_206648 [Polyrhizophydium stewartii]|uniref:Uncharacterized protein n=1 Tax=Polyrhizophydium stewartii TaxID=2732419 RepID=A0ABR4N366_9FUNG
MSASQPAPGEQPAAAAPAAGARRSPTCLARNTDADPCAAVLGGHFDMPLHVAAVFIIMATSFAGTMLPVLGKRLVRSEAGRTAITLLKLFGAGVIVATALVHMFVPANETLTNACLPRAFSRDYKAFAAVFAIAGIFVTHAVQVKTSIEDVDDHEVTQTDRFLDKSDDQTERITASSSTRVPIEDPAQGAINRHSDEADDADMHEGHSHGGLMLHTREKQLVVLLLELGIASHSVIIGLTLGIATDEFKTLLIALCFHQFFEGLALSAIVLDAGFRRWTMAFGMVVFYTLTTPAGIALGIVVRESFNANATQTLLATGVLDAVSAGILIYDALVNVIYPHFSAASFRRASSGFQLVQLLAMYLGCALMSLIGLWA